jgi:hypothetical protein
MDKPLTLVNKKEEKEASESVEELIEITTYIREDQALALEIIENARRYGMGVNFDRGTLIREALDLLIEKNVVGIDLRRDQMVSGADSALR